MALLIVTAVLSVLSAIFDWWLMRILAYIALGYTLFRMFSKNINARRRENDRFLKYWWPVRTKIINQYRKFRGRKDYAYFKCPACRNNLRVPRGKGKIQITCPKCGERFIKKT
jgi:ribosomal protein S27E